MVGARVAYLVVDSVDPEAIAPFWCALLDVGIAGRFADGDYVILGRTADGLQIAFQKVPENKSGKNRLHLDLHVDDLAGATQAAVERGASWDGDDHHVDGYRWRCLLDPEGNEFDLVPVD